MGRIEGSAGGMTGWIGGSNTKIKPRRQNHASNNMKVGGDEKKGEGGSAPTPLFPVKFQNSPRRIFFPRGNCSARQRNMKKPVLWCLHAISCLNLVFYCFNAYLLVVELILIKYLSTLSLSNIRRPLMEEFRLVRFHDFTSTLNTSTLNTSTIQMK